jgi:hypothetical protein
VSLSQQRALRFGAAAAALVLAISSRGDAAVLALALILLRPRPVTAIAIAGAFVAAAWRWGASSLDAIAGAQAVLGPAGWTGTGASAASAWLAGAAVLLVLPRRRAEGEVHLAVGAAVALLVAGPGPGGDLWVRVAAAVVATGASFLVGTLVAGHRGAHLHGHPVLRRSASVLGLLAGLGAVVAAAADAPRWPPTLHWGDVGSGAAVAVAAAGLSLVLVATGTAARWSGGATPPTLGRSTLLRGTR